MKFTSFRIFTLVLIIASFFLNSCKKNEDIDPNELYIEEFDLAGIDVKEWTFGAIKADWYTYDPSSNKVKLDTIYTWYKDDLQELKLTFHRSGKLTATSQVSIFFPIGTTSTWEILHDNLNLFIHYIRMDRTKWRLERHIAKTDTTPERLVLSGIESYPDKNEAHWKIILEAQ